jgi:hypothetical protein
MMGPTHAASGWCAGLLLADVAGFGIREAIACALLAAGFALWPDLDHPRSTVTNQLGMVGDMACGLLRGTSALAYRLTKGPRDEDWSGTHRHLSHTVVFAGITGAGAGWATAVWTWRAVLVLAAFAVLVGAVAAGRWFGWAAGIVSVWWVLDAARSPGGISAAAQQLGHLAGWAGLVVGVGCLVHCLGDSCTLMGCPWLWPVLIAGETWYEIRLPRWLRFRTGGRVERCVVMPVFAVLGVLLVPGVWSMITGAFHPPAAG